jgi:hypothetical protein
MRSQPVPTGSPSSTGPGVAAAQHRSIGAPYRAVCLSGSQGQPLVVSFYPARYHSDGADERLRRAALKALNWLNALAWGIRLRVRH